MREVVLRRPSAELVATRLLVGAVIAALLAGCGSGSKAARQPPGHAVEQSSKGSATIRLRTDAFANAQPIPLRYTCDGKDEPPTLRWDDPPAETRSFALVVEDPDAPGGTFRHWGMVDLPAQSRSSEQARPAAHEVTNDFGKPGYSGPCPPPRGGVHHYDFTLFALDVDHLELGAGAHVADAEAAARHHALAQGELMGTYERKSD